MPNEDRMMDHLVEQLHACLADAMRQSRAGAFDSPVTVAEIYQDLVPYRSVRSRLGFEMNADYEHTLLRLLSGEGNHARLEPQEARDELRAELNMPNPNVGLFRKFAACDVWIAAPREGAWVPPVVEPAAAPAATPSAAPFTASTPAVPTLPHEETRTAGQVWDPPAEPLWEEIHDAPELLLEEEVDETDIIDDVLFEMPTEPKLEDEPPPAAEERPLSTTVDSNNGRALMHVASGHCAFCDSHLPTGRLVKFCPFCGMDQSLHPCAACAEPLQPDWRFCIACGTQTAAQVPAG
jgi:hypothetical protein